MGQKLNNTMKTTIWTSTGFERGIYSPARCIWQGKLPHLFRKGDSIQVLDGFCSETVADACYSIPENSQEIRLETRDSMHEYPTVNPDL